MAQATIRDSHHHCHGLLTRLPRPLLPHRVFSQHSSLSGLLKRTSDRDPPLLKTCVLAGILSGNQKPVQTFQRGNTYSGELITKSSNCRTPLPPLGWRNRRESRVSPDLRSEPQKRLQLEQSRPSQHSQLLLLLLQLPRGKGCQDPVWKKKRKAPHSSHLPVLPAPLSGKSSQKASLKGVWEM